MSLLEQIFTISLLVQLFHALEELITGFHKKWYLFAMPFWVFLLFEIVFEGFWVLVWLLPNFPERTLLQTLFLCLMLANGIQHLVWAGLTKKYVPGLLTAPAHIVIVLIYVFQSRA